MGNLALKKLRVEECFPPDFDMLSEK